jgi:SAM-dependent methyltransferase
MLNLLKEKAGVAGHSPRLVNLSIERFLEATRETYDLVAFSSVLHHLYSYTSVIRQVASAVRPGGIFYSNFDPVVPNRPFLTRAFDSLDIAFTKVMLDPPDVLPGIGRRVKKLFSPTDPIFHRALAGPGDLAEYRANTGVDDVEIIELLQRNGFSTVEHLRYPVGRTRAVRFLNEKFRLLDNFKIIARRDSRFTETSRDSSQANPA